MKVFLIIGLLSPILTSAQNLLPNIQTVPNDLINIPIQPDHAEINRRLNFPPCTMFANVFFTTDVLCANDTTGSAILSISNATFPVQLFLDSILNPFPNGDFINILSAGNHTVVVIDSMGCLDTVFFVINAPPAIVLTASGTNVLCNGDNSGSVTASATGGNGNIVFAWRDCLGGPTLGGAMQSNLFAGCYIVTATDANGCNVFDTVTLTEPLAYTFQASQDSVSCSGLSDGVANIIVMGGSMPYQYVWDNGAMGPSATNLDAGFHFVTVTDANLCPATTLVQVFEPSPLLIDSIKAQSTSCFGANNGKASVFASGGTLLYQYLWDDPAAQSLQTATGLSAGTYQVTVSDWNACTAQAAITVSSPPELLLGFSNVVAETCAGDCLGQATINPSGGVGGYQFFWDDNSIPPGVQTATNLCAGNYQVTLVDANSCTAVNQVAIVGAVPIDVNFGLVFPTCTGFMNGSVVANVSGGSQPYQYLWSNGNTNSDLQNLPCGQFLLTLTDFAGCVRNYTAILDCPQALAILNIAPQHVMCFGSSSGSATVQAQGGTLPLSYLWNDPNAQMNATAQNLPAGNYTVTVTDANGCSIAGTTSISQTTQLVVNITHTNASCLNYGDGTATATASGGVGPYAYNWGAAGSTQTITNLAAGIFVVTVTDANQCTATASVTIGQPASTVSVTASQTRFACWGETDGDAAVSASGSNGAPFTFMWSNGQIGGGATNLPTGLYTVTATDPKGCTGEQTVAIQQLDSIEVVVAYAPPSCTASADGVVAVVLVEGGLGMGDSTQYHYQWSLPGASSFTVVSGFSAGSYRLTVSDLQGCMTILSFDIESPPEIIVQLMLENVSCYGSSDGSITVTGVQNAVGLVNYQWNNNQSGPVIDNLLAGNYSLTATDSKGCTAVVAITLEEPPPLTIAFQTQALNCANDSNGVILTNVNGGIAPYTFLWENGATTDSIRNLGSGNYWVQVMDQNGCIIRDSAEVMQPGTLEISVETIEPECFESYDGRLRILVSGGALPYRYSLNGGNFGGSGVFLALGAGFYNLQVRDANGCIANASATIEQPPQIQVLLGIDTTLVLGDSFLISSTVNNAVGITEYQWSSALVDNFTCVNPPECEEIWVTPGFSNTYRLKVTDENGCMGTGEISIQVQKPRGVYVPTGFTPNGDFENDLLVIHGKSRQISKVLIFKIFDRWGELIYEDQNFPVNDNSRGWDGSFRGQPCDPAVFVWLLEVEYQDGYIETIQGHVTLIR
ncbi:MAG: T9SS type B sorting domain-containing protein [Saprospiraceae bacterium]